MPRCVCRFDLFISLLMSGNLSAVYDIKIIFIFPLSVVPIYIVCTLTVSREITRFGFGILKNKKTTNPKLHACKIKKEANRSY